jgi:hypothetical protein
MEIITDKMKEELGKKEYIEQATKELCDALIQNLEISQREDDIKLAKIASHKRLQLAKDIILNI